MRIVTGDAFVSTYSVSTKPSSALIMGAVDATITVPAGRLISKINKDKTVEINSGTQVVVTANSNTWQTIDGSELYISGINCPPQKVNFNPAVTTAQREEEICSIKSVSQNGGNVNVWYTLDEQISGATIRVRNIDSSSILCQDLVSGENSAEIQLTPELKGVCVVDVAVDGHVVDSKTIIIK